MNLNEIGHFVVFDVEIQKSPEDVGGWDNTGEMGIGVACVYDSRTNAFQLFGEDDRGALLAALDSAPVIAGFNIWSFDFPVICGMSRPKFMGPEGHFYRDKFASRTVDLFRLARLGRGKGTDGPCGYGMGMDAIARETLGAQAGRGKIEHGKEAPGMFQRGEFLRLHNYVMSDVTLERDLLLFAIRHGYLITGQGTSKLPADPLWATNDDGRMAEQFLKRFEKKAPDGGDLLAEQAIQKDLAKSRG